jgi:hypothetical protein
LIRIPDVIFLEEFLSQIRLVGRRLPGHAEDGVTGPEVPLWIAMAVQAPAHEK